VVLAASKLNPKNIKYTSENISTHSMSTFTEKKGASGRPRLPVVAGHKSPERSSLLAAFCRPRRGRLCDGLGPNGPCMAPLSWLTEGARLKSGGVRRLS